MNWLAHLRVAPQQDPLLRLGNLAGDFVRGADLAALPAPLRQGIEQHRAIDRFTDAHPVFRRSRERIAPPLRRFGGVLVDVFYDHFLARRWDRFGTGAPLRAFADEVYGDLLAHERHLPPRLRGAAPHLRSQDWLGAYATIDGIAVTLARMSRRLRRENALGDGVRALREGYEELAGDFESFFPELLAHARDVVHATPPVGA